VNKGEKMKNLSLQYRILLPIVSLIILGMLISGVLSSRSTTEIVNNIMTNQVERISDSLSKQISAWIKDLRADLQTQAEADIYTNLLQQDNPTDTEVQAVNTYMKKYSDRYDSYEGIVLLSAQGKIVANSDPKIVGLDLSAREYFKLAMQDKPNISNVLKSKSSGAPIFTMADPVKKNGQIIGVLVFVIDLSMFSENFIIPIKIASAGYAFMIDKTGIVAAHKNRDLILKMNLNDYDWGREILKNKNGFMNYTLNGEERTLSFQTEPITGWVIGAGAADADIHSAANSLRAKSAIISIIIVLILIVVIILVVRPIVKAVMHGVNFAKQIEIGDLSSRLHLSRSDEIGQLGGALDNMADSLQQRAKLAEAIAEGDLTKEVTLASDKDVLGRALRTMSERLNEILGQITVSSEQIDSGANQVSDSSQDLSQGATEQAAAIEEISASLSELSGRTQTNAENAVTANQLAATAQSAANDGSTQMQQMVSAMNEINESGQNISKIIKTIDEIAFQTNLLALNAAVEAARAGQHGKGFAVVAEEVRNLAARSAKAAQETSDLIEGSVQKGENGTEIANRTAKALEEIVSGISKTTDLVAEIAASSKEQAEGLTQVNDGLSQVDEVVQRNTAGAEESASAAEELSSQSAYMRQLIGQFRLKGQRNMKIQAPTAPRPTADQGSPAAPQPVSQKNDSQWGQSPTSSKPVIALDDNDFGKY